VSLHHCAWGQEGLVDGDEVAPVGLSERVRWLVVEAVLLNVEGQLSLSVLLLLLLLLYLQLLLPLLDERELPNLQVGGVKEALASVGYHSEAVVLLAILVHEVANA